jgi:wyosine [tRNA(Phe)-imidazoG37] synthetase (radical SAM superfamily)
MLLELQSSIIYGPVKSRRLGRSLGVNVLPHSRKVCSFDCLYCQYGRTRPVTSDEAGGGGFPGVNEILEAVEQALRNLPEPPDYITFSGNGEATLHPRFKELVTGLRRVRDAFSPRSKTAILSNSTTVSDPRIREALALLDVRIMKLDAGTEEMFAFYNRPPASITLKDTAAGLAALEDVTIQSLFTKGPDGNSAPGHISAWVEQVKTIDPVFVQVYTLDRSSPTKTLIPLNKNELLDIKTLLEGENIPAGFF